MRKVFLHKIETNTQTRKAGYREAVYAKAVRIVSDAQVPYLELSPEDFEAIRIEFTPTDVHPKSINPPCIHRGAHVGEELCRTCSGTVNVKVFACSVHGRCSLQKPVKDAATCGRCKDRREFEALPTPAATPQIAQWRLNRPHLLTPAERRTISASAAKPATPPPPSTGGPIRFTLGNGQSVSLRGQYRGATAFLICGGPSFARLDAAPLCQPGFLTMAINNAVKTFRPNLWIFSDTADRFIRSAFFDPTMVKFAPASRRTNRIFNSDLWAWTDRTVADCPNVHFFPLASGFDPATWANSDRVVWGNEKDQGGVRSTMLCAIRILHELGVGRVFLLGADGQMSATNTYHFDQARAPGAVRNNTHAYPVLDERFRQVLPSLNAAGMQVFNCNPESKFTAFPHVPYAEAVELTRASFGVDVAKERVSGLYDVPKPQPEPSVKVEPTSLPDETAEAVRRLSNPSGFPALIPKILHFVWVGPVRPDWAEANIETARRLHPDWEIKVWTDIPAEMPEPLKDAARTSDMYCLISDVIRFWAIHTYGGIYLDADVQAFDCLETLRVLDPFVSQGSGRPYCAVTGSAPGHPVTGKLVQNIIDYATQNRVGRKRAAFGPDNVHRERADLLMLPKHLFYFLGSNTRDCIDFFGKSADEQRESIDARAWPHGLKPMGLHVFGLEVAGQGRSSWVKVAK